MRTVAQLLKEARAKADITQERLAERVGYSLSFIRKIEGGQRRASVRQATEFADALGLSSAERAALIAAAQATDEDKPQSRIPAPPTLLLGRDTVVADLHTLLRHHPGRVVTLLGPPGVGKTRLALATASTGEKQFADGVCWAPLASLQSPDLLVPTLLRLVGAAPTGAEALIDQLAAYLGERAILLVLDNCEHLLPTIAPSLALLVERCPQLVVLATSRIPLRLRAEQRFLVPPLALPEPPERKGNQGNDGRANKLDARERRFATIAQSPAVQLFVARASAVERTFVLSAPNAEMVSEIVTRLDGLPLAIELVAAQMDTLSVAEIRLSLDQRFALFATGLHDLPERQRTLHAAIAWSYDLLDSAARAAFARLGVFAGGCTRGAAEALECAAWLEPLTHAGLVVAEEGRWRLLETLRTFAIEQLGTTALLGDARQAHARFFCDLVEDAEEGLLSRENAHWFAQLDAELDYIRAAISWSLHNEVAFALRISSALYLYWSVRSLEHEGLAWMQQAIEAAKAAAIPDASNISSSERSLAKALQWAGYMHFLLGDMEAAVPCLLESITLHERYPPSVEYAAALNTLGLVQRLRGQYYEARRLHSDALTIFEHLEVSHGVARVLGNLGLVTMALGDAAQAYQQLADSVAAWKQLGHDERVASTQILQAIAANEMGNPKEAIHLATHALHIQQMYGTAGTIAECERVIGQAHGHLKDFRQALAHCRAAVRIWWEEQGIDRRTISECLYLSEVALMDGDGIQGVRWLAACEAWMAQTGVSPQAGLRERYQQQCIELRRRNGEEQFQMVWDAGAQLEIGQAIAEMLDEKLS